MAAPRVTAPVSLLAELTHRCPLQCPYCSNPLALEKAGSELETATWLRVLDEAAALGVLQVAFSGGEPTLRRDLEEMLRRAAARGLYSNLITAGVLLDEARLHALIHAGLDHLQLSVQDAEPANADRIGGYRRGHERKLRLAELVRAAGLLLTINAVVHRQNVDNLERIIELALACGAKRLEVAHVQYYGWALVESRGADADPSPDRALGGAERGRQGAPEGRSRVRLRGPGLLRALSEGVHGRVGEAVLNVTPSGRPCRATRPRPSPRSSSTMSGIGRWPRSGTRGRRSTRFAAPIGWRSRAAAVRGRPSTSAAAGARPSR